ncbi:HEPN domain-containing protein [uncultured Kordia sp.]|uniref:HEPN domain-containing protein n=1 Tax=uncultured Kordia sp. TaxID=507699 RepID=UPI00262ADFAB|nr:HEPN domain-containing protein [uncultured Kordia sp.]
MIKNPEKFSHNLVTNFKRLFFTPEIEKRKREKTIDSNFKLITGQVIFFPDDTQPLIRLNNEVSANVKDIVCDNGEKKYSVQKLTLNEKKFENCGHATFIFNDDELVHCSFDFNRNKAIVKTHINSAKEFYKVAKYAAKRNLLNAFIDNAFSSMELLAKSELLLKPMSGLEIKASHNKIKTQYNRYSKSTLDEFEKNKRIIFNQLAELRVNARYLRGNKKLTFEKKKIIKTLKEVIKELYYIVEN